MPVRFLFHAGTRTLLAIIMLFVVLDARSTTFPLEIPKRPTSFPLQRPAQVGEVVAWGTNTFGQITIPAGATNVVAISAGLNHNLALRTDGSVIAWGDNSFGQFNVPARMTAVFPVAAGEF